MFDVIDEVLTDGPTSRLYSTLVRDSRLAASVNSDANYPGVRSPNLFVLSATPLAPHTTAEVEAAILAELERLKTEPVSAKELERIVNNLDADMVRALRSNSGLASQLAFYQTVAGDWRYVLKSRDKIAAVTPGRHPTRGCPVLHEVESHGRHPGQEDGRETVDHRGVESGGPVMIMKAPSLRTRPGLKAAVLVMALLSATVMAWLEIWRSRILER